MRKIFLFLFAAVLSIGTAMADETVELNDFTWELLDGSLVMSTDWNETPIYVEIYNVGEAPESGTYNAYLNLGGFGPSSIDNAEASVELMVWANGIAADMTGTFVSETTGTVYHLNLVGFLPSIGGEAQEYTVEAADLTAIITDDGLSMKDNDALQVLVYGFEGTSETGAYEFELITNDFYASGEINVTVEGSVVTITGDVTGWDWFDEEVLVHVNISGMILDPTAALPVTVTNLQVTTDTDMQMAMLEGTGSHQLLGQLTFSLILSNYTGENIEYQLSGESLVSYQKGWLPVEAAPTGSLTKSYSNELGTDVYSGNVSFTTADGEYNIELTMYYVAPITIDMTINNATLTWSGDNLQLTAQWGTYPVALTLYSYEIGAEVNDLTIEVGDWEAEDNWYGMLYNDYAYPLTVTENNHVLTITGYFIHTATEELHKVTISGELPTEEEEEGNVSADVVVMNLTVEYDSESNVWVLWGSDDVYTFTLALDEEPVVGNEYTLNSEYSFVQSGRSRGSASGSLTMDYDEAYGGDMYVGPITVTLDGVLHEIQLTMVNFSQEIEPIELMGSAEYTLENGVLSFVASCEVEGEEVRVSGELDGCNNELIQDFENVVLEVGEGDDSFYIMGSASIWVEDGELYVMGDFTFAEQTPYSVMVWGTPPAVPDYTRTVTSTYGTICLPFGSTNYTGATFYEFVGSETGKVYLGSVTTLEAGVPYIFEASAAEVAVYGDGTTAATPGKSNGLYGTFTDNTEVAVGNYILKDDALCQAETTCWVNAYRAYIVMSEVPTGVPTQMPGRRYIGMGVQGENEATGFENITAPEGQTIKAIENGQLIIIRNGEKFNVQGQLVK